MQCAECAECTQREATPAGRLQTKRVHDCRLPQSAQEEGQGQQALLQGSNTATPFQTCNSPPSGHHHRRNHWY